MLFGFLKKKNNNKINVHNVTVKLKKDKLNKIYIGKIVNIDVEEGNDHENFYFSTYEDGNISNKISIKEYDYCEKYNYGIIKEILDDEIVVSIICEKGYIQRLKTNLKNIENGTSFIIKGNDLISDNEIVGQIIDHKYNESSNILLNVFDNDKLIIFIKK